MKRRGRELELRREKETGCVDDAAHSHHTTRTNNREE
jgi:hypothetical protein